jgi:ribosomal protein L37AE/L43A
MHTQKYGASIRKLVDKAILAKRARYECPKCHKLKVVRKSNAVWRCKCCDATFAGGAYSLTSEAGGIAGRMIAEFAKTE